jgi:hypothetical protein
MNGNNQRPNRIMCFDRFMAFRRWCKGATTTELCLIATVVTMSGFSLYPLNSPGKSSWPP